jgi:hypothetical protein
MAEAERKLERENQMTNKKQHTPGPWIIPDGKQLISAKGADCGRFTICVMNNHHRPEQSANARLIALSPDLYAFAAMIARMTQDGEEVDGEEFVMENDDAVATVNGLIDHARSLTANVRGDA